MRHLTTFLFLLLAVAATGALAPDVPRSEFDRVTSGAVVVYSIDDLTSGQQQLADRIGALIQDTVDSNAWKGEWRGATLRATPHCLTVKATTEDQNSVLQLLSQLREQRNLFVRLNYQLVSAKGEAAGASKAVIENPLQSGAIRIASNAVGLSQANLLNGEDTLLLDGTDLKLPTIAAMATVSADRKAVTFKISIKDAGTLGDAAKPILFSSPLGQSAGVRIPTASGVAWLILEPQLVERDWAPAGTARQTSWVIPGGRPEGSEDWEQTLRRQVLEEACAVVTDARLSGFTRGHCIEGPARPNADSFDVAVTVDTEAVVTAARNPTP